LSTNFKSSDRANQITSFNAYNKNKPCVNYCLNIGDITLRENKASGYQENIPSLTKILETYHPDDIRILFLSNEFNETIYLDNETLNDAKTFKLSLIKKIADLYKYLSLESTSIELDCTEKYDEIDLILLINFRSIKHNIFSSVCDCINTKQVMVNIDKLLQLADDYVKKETTKINKYLTKNTTRRNCSKVKRLIFNTQIYLSKAVYEYFPSL
jgi:cysteinyl-tRNA synthetase